MWKDNIRHHSKTDVGVKRSHNQDASSVALAASQAAWERRGHLFVVADGMGAHAVGELASKMAVQTIEHIYPRLKGEDPADALRSAFIRANESINEKGNQNPEFKGMGTTATALALLPDGAYIGHVGDSRCYRIRKDCIEQLTYDHSLQWEIARQRRVNPEELDSIPTNVIVRSLGPQADVRADTAGPHSVLVGDQFLLCSDGLSGPVKDDELWAAACHLEGAQACQFLVDLANLRGGLDNITLVLVSIGGEPDPDGKPTPYAKRPWHHRVRRLAGKIPQEWWYFLGGVATAAAGAALVRYGDWTVILSVMGMALTLLGVAFWTSFRRRKRFDEKANDNANKVDAAPIHRRRDCTLDRGLVELVAKDEQRLRELAIEQSWKVAWDELAPTQKGAETAHEHADWPTAYRLYCQAISILAVGMRLYQDKHEVLIPQWDRYRK